MPSTTFPILGHRRAIPLQMMTPTVSSEDTCRVNNLKSVSLIEDASYSNDDIRAQLDTGAMVTCTNFCTLYDFRYYDSKFPCTKRLTGAIDKSVGVLPLGEGSLRVPAINRQGYIAVKCLYSPHLTSTLLSENDVLLTSEDSETGYSGQTIAKHFTNNRSTGNFTLLCNHKLRCRQDILLHGVIVASQCYTHPLRLSDFPIDHPLATIYNSSAMAARDDPQFAKDFFAGTVKGCCGIPTKNINLSCSTIYLVPCQ